MARKETPLLIKRYASRRLYNTETSDYVTLDDIARFIREGRDVKIVDLKTGDDLTRQYLLQIIAEHESRGESMLPIDVLTDLVRSYATHARSVVPDFLAMSFDLLRQGQEKALEQMQNVANPLAGMPGFEAMKAQQEAFLKVMMGGWSGPEPDTPETDISAPEASETGSSGTGGAGRNGRTDAAAVQQRELDEIRAQLAELQSKLSEMGEQGKDG